MARSAPERGALSRAKSGFDQSWDAIGESAVPLFPPAYGRREHRMSKQ